MSATSCRIQPGTPWESWTTTTYFELLAFHHERLADVADYLTSSREDWTMLFIETHASDYTSHFFLGQAEKFSGADEETQQRCLEGMIPHVQFDRRYDWPRRPGCR